MSSTKPHKYLLIDCNQFYVSCEQVFNPLLRNKPVVVLSNNDGCIVARSKQAKDLGIPMGAPFFKYADLMKYHKVHALSSNYTLYGDMSQRVMQVLSLFSSEMEEYSIDEAFLKVEDSSMAQEIQRRVLQWTGIPVSIGIGSTKTLAKVANDIAKKGKGIFDLSNPDAALEKLPVGEVWGIGRRLCASLNERGIYTAKAFKDAPDEWIRKHFSVILLRTAWELRGIPCLKLEDAPCQRKSVTCSRSFSKTLTSLADVEEALSYYTAIAAEKLRNEELLPSFLSVFLMTSRFATPRYSNCATVMLEEPSHFTPQLVSTAKDALRQIFRPGYPYKKVGVTLGGFSSEKLYQPDLFSLTDKKKQERVMKALDQINVRFGSDTLRFASEGIAKEWKGKKDSASPRYTTSWKELLTVAI